MFCTVIIKFDTFNCRKICCIPDGGELGAYCNGQVREADSRGLHSGGLKVGKDFPLWTYYCLLSKKHCSEAF